MRTRNQDTVSSVICTGIGVALVVGWVMNVVKLVYMPLDPVTGELVLRAVGVAFAPLGSVMGFL